MRLIIPQVPAGLYAAQLVKKRIKQNPKAVLCLPTGGTAVDMYKNIVELHKKGEISFKETVTFNMDEYVNLPPGHPQSYRSFMQEHLFNHIDIKKENIHIPDGNAPDLDAQCKQYESDIAAAGGIDLLLGGLGENGHLAFNEPYSSLNGPTHKVFLTESTIKANSRFFGEGEAVPSTALSIGVGTIMAAREAVILVTGFKKAEALRAAVEGPVCSKWVASVLQLHRKAVIVADMAAVSGLEPATYEYFKNLKDEYSEIETLCGV